MKRAIGTLATRMRILRGTLLFTSILFIMGVIFGAILVNVMGPEQRNELLDDLNQFFLHISHSQTDSPGILNMLGEELRLVLVLWILGLSVIGFPLILAIVFAKGMAIGFTVGFLVQQLTWKGILLAAVSVLPQNLLLIPALLLASSASILFSLSLLRMIFRKGPAMVREEWLQYNGIMLTVGGIFFVAVLVESYVSPYLIGWVTSAWS